MFNTIRKDKNRRTLVKKFEIQRLQNKVLLQDRLLNKNLIAFFDKMDISRNDKNLLPEKANNSNLYSFWRKKTLKASPRNSSKSRVQNRCIESGRSRAVLRFCKLSRICLRDKASRGAIPGVSKASW